MADIAEEIYRLDNFKETCPDAFDIATRIQAQNVANEVDVRVMEFLTTGGEDEQIL